MGTMIMNMFISHPYIKWKGLSVKVHIFSFVFKNWT
jgi:hypothetical protein